MPFEVPEGWVWTTLGNIGTWQAGGTPNRSNKEYYGGNIPWLKTGDLNDSFIISIPESITEEAVSKSSAKLNPKGSVLMAMYGATIGKLGILTFPAATNQACCACIQYDAVVQMYLFYYLMSQRSSFIEKGGGGAQPNISKEIIINTAIPVPPLSEQSRIVSQIDYWFSIIEKIESAKVNLKTCIDQTKNKILTLAIHGKLVPQDPNDEPAIELLKRVNPNFTPCDNAHYPQLPKSWCLASLGDLCSLCDGRKRIEEYLPYIDVKYLRKEKSTETISAGKYVSKGSLLILVDGENSGEVFRAPCNGYQGSTFKQLVINNNVHTEYLLLVIEMSRKMLRENKVGSAIPHLNKKIFKAIPVHLPPYQEQTRIVDEVTNLNKLLDIIMEGL